MKSIENKETEIINVDENGNYLGKCKYSNLINIVLKSPKQGGLDYEDVEHRIAISKAGREDPPTIELEDAYFNYLKKLVKDAKWAFFHEDVLKFKEDILAIK